jgi:DNA-binding NtrC family response regulator
MLSNGLCFGGIMQMETAGRNNILIIDPQKIFADNLKTNLEEAGYNTIHFSEPSEIDSGSVNEYDVCICDFKSFSEHEAKLMKGLAGQDSRKGIILTSTTRVPETSYMNIKDRVFAVVQKPVRPFEIVETVNRALEGTQDFDAHEAKLRDVIGGKLRVLRKQQRLTLKVLSIKTGLSQSLISKIELGRSAASVSTLLKLSLALEVPIRTFFE